MADLPDIVIRSICHGGGEHAALLPLCLRCSSVYAGVVLGLTFEAVFLALGKTAGRKAILLNSVGLALMAGTGIGGLYGLPSPDVVKVTIGLFFGTAVGFFAASAVAHELALRKPGGREPLLSRALLLAALLSWGAFVASGARWSHRALGFFAMVGAPAAFASVNLAIALVLLRKLRTRHWRVVVAIVVATALAASEIAGFALWRDLWGVSQT